MKKLLLILVLAICQTLVAQPGANDPSFNTSDIGFGYGDGAGGIRATAIQSDGKIIIGGSFITYNATTVNRISRLNSDGVLDGTFNVGTGANDIVSACAIQSDGKIIIGGFFTAYNGTPITGIARLNTDGTLDGSFNVGTGANGFVAACAIQSDGKIIIGGVFTAYNGTTVNRLARLNIDGTLDGTFNVGTGANSEVSEIGIQPDGKIIIGGYFTSYNGTPINYIARINSDGSLDGTFNVGTGADNNVYAISIQSDGKITIGGIFTSYNGIPINRIARLNTDGTLDGTLNVGTGADASIATTALQSDGKIIIAGAFTSYNGTSINRIARINTDGTIDGTFIVGAGADNYVNTIVIQTDGKIIIGGSFLYYGGTYKVGIARIYTNGSIDGTFNVGTGASGGIYVTSIQSDGKIIIGGTFRSYNGTTVDRISRINSDGTLDGTFNVGTGADNFVYAAAIQSDGKIIIGGNFTSYNGTLINRIARLNSDGTLDGTFNVGLGANNYVREVVIQSDGKIIIAGYFTSYNGTSIKHIARLNSDGTLDGTFNVGTGPSSYVYTTAIQTDGKIIIGGIFTSYNGTPIQRVARLNTDGTLDGTFTVGTGTNSAVNKIAIQSDGKIIIGGGFTSFNGTVINRIARINSDGTLDGTFNVGTGANSTVNTVAIQSDGKIIIGGWFASFNGITTSRIARINTNGTLDGTFTAIPGANQILYAIAIQSDEKIIIGGLFTSYNGAGRNRIARILNCAIPTVTVNATSTTLCNGTAITLTGSGATTYSWTGGVTDGVSFTPNATGTYTVTGTSSGCSNTATVVVSVNQPSTNSQIFTECAGFSVIVGANTYTSTGIYTDVLTAANGCDSTVTTNLTINNPSTGSQTFTECAGFSVIVGANTYTSTGIYTDVLTAANGCDSTVTTNLTINTLDNTTTTSANVILANASGAAYQWVDCNNSNSAIAGETNQSYTASANGDYAVIVTENGCVDTSNCVNINTTGIEASNAQTSITIYPNPVTNGNINIEINNLEAGYYSIVLYNALGKQVFNKSFEATNTNTNVSKIQINEQLAKGIYFVNVKSVNGTVINRKLVVQ